MIHPTLLFFTPVLYLHLFTAVCKFALPTLTDLITPDALKAFIITRKIFKRNKLIRFSHQQTMSLIQLVKGKNL